MSQQSNNSLTTPNNQPTIRSVRQLPAHIRATSFGEQQQQLIQQQHAQQAKHSLKEGREQNQFIDFSPIVQQESVVDNQHQSPQQFQHQFQQSGGRSTRATRQHPAAQQMNTQPSSTVSHQQQRPPNMQQSFQNNGSTSYNSQSPSSTSHSLKRTATTAQLTSPPLHPSTHIPSPSILPRSTSISSVQSTGSTVRGAMN